MTERHMRVPTSPHVTRREAMAALGATAMQLVGCRPTSSAPRAPNLSASPMPTLRHHPASRLPATRLPWLSLRDHFIATVGPASGRGSPLGPLLVLADATFAPHSRFPLHPHREMEILSIVVDGTLSHHGDQAHGATLGSRSAQLISARTGIVHAEGNDTDRATRMLQLWFQPREEGGAPAYFARTWSGDGRHVVAGDDVMPLRADARVEWLALAAGASDALIVRPGRVGYVLGLEGRLAVDDAPFDLAVGDGLEVGEGSLRVHARSAAAALFVDVSRA